MSNSLLINCKTAGQAQMQALDVAHVHIPLLTTCIIVVELSIVVSITLAIQIRQAFYVCHGFVLMQAKRLLLGLYSYRVAC